MKFQMTEVGRAQKSAMLLAESSVHVERDEQEREGSGVQGEPDQREEQEGEVLPDDCFGRGVPERPALVPDRTS